MVFSTVFSGVGWTFDRIFKVQRETFTVLRDPVILVTAGAAGFVGRAATLSIDNGGPKGGKHACCRRASQFGILMWVYVPVASRMLPGTECDPSFKAFTTFIIGAISGLTMRIVCNPLNRVLDECLRTGNSVSTVCRALRNKTVLQFYYTTPPLLGNALYFGTLLTVFEGLRRFSERSRLLPMKKDESGVAVLSARNCAIATVGHTVIGGAAAFVASVLCYPISAHVYQQTVIHDSAICRGLLPTLRKEVPLMAVSFGMFSLFQSLFAPHHGARAGFGY
uniref:Mitochondrial carrier protein n=1 Tax=Trypanosoma vivax (strain Y486) TaxID=1055687 RepID=G0TX22_TRYVY|nr:conserved hypothetical protein [Trypanosoma vivax Y486]